MGGWGELYPVLFWIFWKKAPYTVCKNRLTNELSLLTIRAEVGGNTVVTNIDTVR